MNENNFLQREASGWKNRLSMPHFYMIHAAEFARFVQEMSRTLGIEKTSVGGIGLTWNLSIEHDKSHPVGI